MPTISTRAHFCPLRVAPVVLLLMLPGCTARGPVHRAPACPPAVLVDVATSGYVDVPDLIRKLSEILGDAPRHAVCGSALRITALPGYRGVRLRGAADRVAQVQRLLARPPGDPPPSPGAAIVTVIPLRHRDAVTVLGRLPGPLLAGARVKADPPTNSLVVVASPDVAARLRRRAFQEDRPVHRPRPRR